MNDALHPIIAAALAPWTPPRTPEEEARWLAADAAAAAEKQRPDYEQLRADRIERRDAAAMKAMAPRGLPGEPL